MNDLISVCIPTFRRPALLRRAIESSIDCAHRPLELIIGDDSGDDVSAAMTASLPLPAGVTVRHQRHVPGLGQARNVNWLFAHAAGDRLVLLHDDDEMCQGGIDRLAEAWSRHRTPPLCAYGKQFLIDEQGSILAPDTLEFNVRYRRTQEHAGTRLSRLDAALLQQLPNNGFLVRRDAATAVAYRTEEEIGQSVDCDFGIRLATSEWAGDFVYVDEFVSCYRLTANSNLRSLINHGQHLLFDYVQGLEVPPESAAAKALCLKRLSAEAVLDAAMARDRSDAMRILASPYYRHSYLSPWTWFRLLSIAFPRVAGSVRSLWSMAR